MGFGFGFGFGLGAIFGTFPFGGGINGGGSDFALNKKATAASTVALLEAAVEASASPNPIERSVSFTLGWEAERSMMPDCTTGAGDHPGAGAAAGAGSTTADR